MIRVIIRIKVKSNNVNIRVGNKKTINYKALKVNFLLTELDMIAVKLVSKWI